MPILSCSLSPTNQLFWTESSTKQGAHLAAAAEFSHHRGGGGGFTGTLLSRFSAAGLHVLDEEQDIWYFELGLRLTKSSCFIVCRSLPAGSEFLRWMGESPFVGPAPAGLKGGLKETGTCFGSIRMLCSANSSAEKSALFAWLGGTTEECHHGMEVSAAASIANSSRHLS